MAEMDSDNSKDPKMSSFSTRPSRAFGLKHLKSSGLRRRVSLSSLLRMLFLLLTVFAISFGAGWLGARTYNNGQPAPTSTAAKQQYISNESDLIAGIAKNAGQGVVSIDATQTVSTPDLFGFNNQTSQEAAGTGFIISADGTIVTNRHVVPSGSSDVSVTLADGTRYDNVQVIGRTSASSSLDVAFLKIGDLKGKKLTPLTLGDSSRVQVGDKVIAIGNALGQFQNTVTSGIVSGYGRDVVAGDQTGSSESLTDLFQTDAAINEGNSGGPLVNINGEVIGINVAVASGSQNIGFAIPINDVKGLITSVLGKGRLEQPYLGVRYVSLTDDLAYQYNLSVKRGAYIVPAVDGQASVIPGSPADKAGLKEKDIITKVNDIKIDDRTSLTSALSRLHVGDSAVLTVVRGNQTLSIKVTIGNTPS